MSFARATQIRRNRNFSPFATDGATFASNSEKYFFSNRAILELTFWNIINRCHHIIRGKSVFLTFFDVVFHSETIHQNWQLLVWNFFQKTEIGLRESNEFWTCSKEFFFYSSVKMFMTRDSSRFELEVSHDRIPLLAIRIDFWSCGRMQWSKKINKIT